MSAVRRTIALVRILILPLWANTFAAKAELPASASRDVLQPVHEYFNVREAVADVQDGEYVLNGFLNYTHLGTDFGFLGPSELRIRSAKRGVSADLSGSAGGWAGVWHSLNGLAREKKPLDLRAFYSPLILPEFQPRVIGVHARVAGTGKFKLELKAAGESSAAILPETSLWTTTIELAPGGETQEVTATLDADAIPYAHYLNWVAEPGSRFQVDSLSLRLQLPVVDFPTYVFLASYAKLARCYRERTGLVQDRAHTGDDSLNNIPATGMFALATAAAHRAGIVDAATARATLKKVTAAIDTLPRKDGLLPHFVRWADGRWVTVEGSEYSTIDTALCLLALRLAANALEDEAIAQHALEMLQSIDMSKLRDADGFVLHGLREDGTPLPAVWRDWGGETALVLMMQRIAAGPTVVPRMDDSGRSYRGVGFITELPGLFFPQFNTHMFARAGAVDWLAYRRQRLTEQKAYFPTHAPESTVARLGLYGLSAGEGKHGIGYAAVGVEDPGQRVIYPHYILMSGLVESNTSTVYQLLAKMEQCGWLTPLGLVENISVDGKSYLPMIGSLNAAFEALSAYHLLVKHQGESNPIYLAASRDAVFEDAAKAVFVDPENNPGGTEAE